MPRFHFNVHGDQSLSEGIDLPTIAEAKNQATRFVARLMSDNAAEFWEAGHLGLSVADENGLLLFSIEIVGTDAPAIRIEMPHQQ